MQRAPSPAKPGPHATHDVLVASGADPIPQTSGEEGVHAAPLFTVPAGQVDAHAAEPAGDAPDAHALHVSSFDSVPPIARYVPAAHIAHVVPLRKRPTPQ